MADIRRVEEEKERIEFKPDREVTIKQKCPKCGRVTQFRILRFIEKEEIVDKVWARIRCSECGYETTRFIPEEVLEKIEYEKIKERMGVI